MVPQVVVEVHFSWWLRVLLKASHDKPSYSQFGGTVEYFGCTPVVRRQVTTARTSHPEGIDEEGGNGAPVNCGGERVAFQTSRDLGEIREMKFLGILEQALIGRMGLISARWRFSPRMWPRVYDKMGSSNENILRSPCFLYNKYGPSRPLNSPSATGCNLI